MRSSIMGTGQKSYAQDQKEQLSYEHNLKGYDSINNTNNTNNNNNNNTNLLT